MSIPGSGSPLLLATTAAAAADAGYVIPKSLRFNSGDSAYLNKTPSSAGNRRTWTWSGWIKRTSINNGANVRHWIFIGGNTASDTGIGFIGFKQNDDLLVGSNNTDFLLTTRKFRDLSAWYHIVVAFDSTQATASNRIKVYVNGVEETNFSTDNRSSVTQNGEYGWNRAERHTIGSVQNYGGNTVQYIDAYMADMQFVDGQALAPTDFGETRSSDGVWVPKEYSPATSPNDGTTWSSSCSGTIYSSSLGYANAFDGSLSTASHAANGNTITFTPSSAIPVSSSVRIFCSLGSITGSSGTADITINGTSYVATANTNRSDGYFTVTGITSITSITWERAADNDLVVVSAIEVDGEILLDDFNNSSGYGRNGFHLNFSDSSTNEALGFDSAPTIPALDPKKGMDVITYTGTGAARNIGGLNFEPGLIWIKRRNSAKDHAVFDSVRGTLLELFPNSTQGENTKAGSVTSFNPDGFSLGDSNRQNENGYSNVAWCWRAGGPAVANTDGTIAAQVSANTDYGFSIVSYTGNGTADATIGHGLTGQTPKFIIVKDRTQTQVWNIYHASKDTAGDLHFDTSTGTVADKITATSSTTFTVADDGNVNRNNDNYIAYCWSEISGYSKFGSYTGDGTSTKEITTGFKPRFLLVKPTSSTGNWNIFDSERPANTQPITYSLQPNLSNQEYQSEPGITFNDDGFTLNSVNTNGVTYIYAAFADRPGNNWDVNNIVTNEGLTTSKTQFDVVTYTGNGGAQAIGQPVYSDQTTGGNNTSNMFDGSGSSWNNLTAGNTITFTPSPAIACTQLEIWLDTATPIRVNVNGGGYGSTFTQGSLGYVDITPSGGMTSLTSLLIDAPSGGGGTGAGIRGLRINGTTIVVDGDGGPGLKFQPDFVWIKRRDDSAKDHNLYDVVRGASGGYYNQLVSNVTSVENNNSSDYGRVTALNSNGFTVDSATSDHSLVNDNGDSYVAWCWKAGGTAVSNTDGSITSQVSANPSAGFSIVSFNGTAADGTVGHGLNAKPSLYIVKNRDTTSSWFAFTDLIDGSNDYLYLDTTGAKNDTGANYANVATSSVFYMGIAVSGLNASGDDHIAYCFANVPGYQRVGKYTGNGTSTGPVIVTGFKPRFILFKRTNSARDWEIYDTERSGDSNTKALYPASSAVEGGNAGPIKINSDGFQPLTNSASNNGSGDTYIYLAIGDDEIGSDEDCLVDVPNAVTADADATDTTGGYQRGNYATINPLMNRDGQSITLANGNLSFTSAASSGQYGTRVSTIGVTSGKWYAEFTVEVVGNGIFIGITRDPDGDSNFIGAHATSYGYLTNGQKYNNNSGSSYGDSYTAGDVISIAMDLDNDTVAFYKNGVSQGTAYSSLAASTYFMGISGAVNAAVVANFGQMRFKYPIPSGYAALNTTALPAATVADGSAYFDALTYTSDGQSSKKLTFGFSPDFFWSKVRNFTEHHVLHDSVRGASKVLKSSSNAAESTESSGRGVLSFDSDGVTIGIGSPYNSSGNNSVVWAWDAGSSTASNTDGSVTTTVRANPTAGFSIVKFTVPSGSDLKSYGHGLNAEPSIIFTKRTDGAGNWQVFTNATGSNQVLTLNSTGAASSASSSNYAQSNSTFSLKNGHYTDTGWEVIAYCFTPVAGYSSVGSYTGNGSNDGPFVHTGFKPRWLMIKRTDSTSNWVIIDAARSSFNEVNDLLYAEQNLAETVDDGNNGIDFLSNGFKLRKGVGGTNVNNATLVYIAFASNPFQANGGLAR